MKNKIQKFQEELDRNDAKMTALKERNRELEQKISEAETLEIRALLRSEKLSMDDLIALARSRKENQELPSFTGRQGDVTDDAPDGGQRASAYDHTDSRRDDDMEEDEDDDY